MQPRIPHRAKITKSRLKKNPIYFRFPRCLFYAETAHWFDWVFLDNSTEMYEKEHRRTSDIHILKQLNSSLGQLYKQFWDEQDFSNLLLHVCALPSSQVDASTPCQCPTPTARAPVKPVSPSHWSCPLKVPLPMEPTLPPPWRKAPPHQGKIGVLSLICA